MLQSMGFSGTPRTPKWEWYGNHMGPAYHKGIPCPWESRGVITLDPKSLNSKHHLALQNAYLLCHGGLQMCIAIQILPQICKNDTWFYFMETKKMDPWKKNLLVVFYHPFEKYDRQNRSFPQGGGVNIKNIWNQHLENICNNYGKFLHV